MPNEIKKIHKKIKKAICERKKEFLENQKKPTKIFKELVFCLLTPQSKAEKAWESVNNLFLDKKIFEKDAGKLAEKLKVRFKFNKAKYLKEAYRKYLGKERKLLVLIKEKKSIIETRDYLVKEIKGFGYKEASHFLRNIGFGKEIAILDRHILRNLVRFGVIKEIPKTLNRKKYLEIEEKMRKFALNKGVPLFDLDFIFWYKETGKVFK